MKRWHVALIGVAVFAASIYLSHLLPWGFA